MLSRTAIRRAVLGVVPVCLAVFLCVTGFGFLVAAVFLGLLKVMTPPLAALLTSLLLVSAALIVMLVARTRRRRVAPQNGLADLVPLLQLAAGQKPWATLVTAAIAGALTELTMKGNSSTRPPV